MWRVFFGGGGRWLRWVEVAKPSPGSVERRSERDDAEEEAEDAGHRRDDEELGVEAQPGEVQANLHPEVAPDKPQRLLLVPVAE